MALSPLLAERLATGATTLCRCWKLSRMDGTVLGFTDHDRDITFDGVTFKGDSGLGAEALQQTTGLAVNNVEAVGALSHTAVREEDLVAGRFDGARIWTWRVDWRDPSVRQLQFHGRLGEIETGAGGFRAELRGLSEELNRPQGRIFGRLCTARLGDGACRVDLSDPAFRAEATVAEAPGGVEWVVSGIGGYAAGWFERGELRVLTGAAAGLGAMIKADLREDGARRFRLWQDLRAPLVPGDRVRVTAGCDKRAETCRQKFGNFLNFRGFPHIPGEDWMLAYPKQTGINDGGSVR